MDLFKSADTISSSKTRDKIVKALYQNSREFIEAGVAYTKTKHDQRTKRLDAVLTSPVWGFPIMLLMLGAVFYLTIAGDYTFLHASTFFWMA